MQLLINLHADEMVGSLASKYKKIQIGLLAYKSWCQHALSEIQQLAVSAMTDDVTDIDSGDEEYMQLPFAMDEITGDECTTIGALSVSSFKAAIANEGDVTTTIPVTFIRHDGVEEVVGVPYNGIHEAFSSKIDSLQSHIALTGTALRMGVNSSVNATDIKTELDFMGIGVTSTCASIVQNLAGSARWSDALELIFESKTKDDTAYSYTFERNAYTQVSGVTCAVRAVAREIREIWSKVDFNLQELGQSVERAFKAMRDMFEYIVSLISPEVLTDYTINQGYNMEALDIPFASVNFKLSDIPLDQAMHDTIAESLGSGSISLNSIESRILGLSPFAYYTGGVLNASGELGGIGVAALPSTIALSDWISGLGSTETLGNFLPIGHCVTIPVGYGFLVVNHEDDDSYTAYSFYGAWSNQSSNYGKLVYDPSNNSVDGTLNPNDSDITVIPSPISVANNKDMMDWIRQFSLTSDSSFQQRTARYNGTFLGSLIHDKLAVLPGGSVSDDYNPGNIIDVWKSNYLTRADFNGANETKTKLALLLSLSALMHLYTLVSVPGTTNYSAAATYFGDQTGFDFDYEGNTQVYFSGNADTSWVPYVKDTPLVFAGHGQTDNERAEEITGLMKKVLLAAAVATVAVAAIKVKRTLQVKAIQANFDQNILISNLQSKVMNGEPIDYTDVKALKKAAKKAKRLKSFTSSVLPSTTAAAIQDALASNNSLEESFDFAGQFESPVNENVLAVLKAIRG